MDREFLASRTTKSSIRRGMSSWVPVKSGVPQGSVIGPILLVVYINDIPPKINYSPKFDYLQVFWVCELEH